jgi:gluconate kinase
MVGRFRPAGLYHQDHAPESVQFVHLRGSEALIRRRLASRTGHFMSPALLHSQFETLEPPDRALPIDVDAAPEEVVSRIRCGLGL